MPTWGELPDLLSATSAKESSAVTDIAELEAKLEKLIIVARQEIASDVPGPMIADSVLDEAKTDLAIAALGLARALRAVSPCAIYAGLSEQGDAVLCEGCDGIIRPALADWERVLTELQGPE